MSKRPNLPIDTDDLVKNLKESKGRGFDALFTPPPASNSTENNKHDTNNKDESGTLTHPEEHGEPVKEPKTSALPQKTEGAKLQRNEAVHKKESKRKVGAYFTKAERQNLKDLDYMLNRGDNVIGQSEIMALSVEVLLKMLNGSNKRFSSEEKLREYIDSLLDKAKAT